ncbi:MAG: 1-phosphofructokinase [Oscillospiraceae bacterium]|nr:1-phosphofructokinase [Oscillospiraceae bacterium]
MIYTVTFNPAVDYVVKTDELIAGQVNRSERESVFFGGKGINVSIILKELGINSEALGFVAGFTGKAIEEGISSAGIKTNFVHLKNGFSRINVKIKSNTETELNGQGPKINEDEVNELYRRLDKLNDGDILVLAGSVPSSLPRDIYEKIIAHLEKKKIRFVVDAANDLLLNVLISKPFIIKPNNFELSEMFNTEINSTDEVIFYAKKLREMGACNVLVSMAENGAVLADENGSIHVIDAPKGKAINSVGAGDAMLAGFLAGFLEKGDYGYALKLGTAAGSATAFSEDLARKADIEKLLKTL